MPTPLPPENTRFKPGQSGNPKGRPKGVPNLSTAVRKLLDDEAFVDKIIRDKPSWWKSMPEKNGATAIVAVMIAKAIQGDVRAANWISKTGYGNKVDVTSDEQPIPILGAWRDALFGDETEKDQSDGKEDSRK